MATSRRQNSGQGRTTRYAIYCRCSTDDQKEGDFTTVQVQEQLNREYVQQRRGTLIEVYKDEGISGTTMKRPGLQRLLADAAAGRIDAVVVTYMSRLGRGNPYVIAEYELSKSGVRVEVVREKFTDDLAGYVTKSMTVMMDGIYPKMVSQWTSTKMEQMVAQGYWCGQMPTIGFKMAAVEGASVSSSGKQPPKRLVPNAEEAEIVQHAYRLFLEKRTIAAVRDFLASVTDRTWTTTKTKALLTHEAYVGVQQFGKWRNEAAHEPIVDRDLFDAVQAQLPVQGTSRPPRSSAYSYYLRGLVHCPYCGCRYSPYSAKSGKVHYYSCLRAQKKLSECPVKLVNADSLHYSVLHLLNRAARHQTVMHRLIAESEDWNVPVGEIATMRGHLAKRKGLIQGQITNIVNVLSGGHQSGALISRLTTLEAELADLEQRLSHVQQTIEQTHRARPRAQDVQQVWSEVLRLWEVVPEEDRGVLLSSVVRKVDIKAKDRVALKLSPVAELHGPKFVINSRKGAGTGLEPVTFGL